MPLAPPCSLRPTLPIAALLPLALPGEVLGAWLRAARRPFRVRVQVGAVVARLLCAPDLGLLMRRCRRVALRRGGDILALPAEDLLRWRVLQVVTGTPYLPDLERLSALFPDLAPFADGFVVRVAHRSPEEVLAAVRAADIPIAASQIGYAEGAGIAPLRWVAEHGP